MTDLFDDAAQAEFIAAIRDVTDTFQRYPVIFGDEDPPLELLCGRKSIKNELLAREEGESIEDAFKIVINRQYLAEKGLIDENDMLLIGYDTPVEMDGLQFTIIKLSEPTVFRDKKLNVVMEIIR